MVPIHSLFLVGAALALFGESVEAQIQQQVQQRRLLRRVDKLSGQVTFDLGTGTYTRGPVAHDRGGTTITDFSNIDVFGPPGFGFTSCDTGGGACTWFSSASKGLGMNQGGQPVPGSDLISEIVFFYCSGALDSNSGGFGGTVELGFYEGYTVFGGAPTTAATVFTLAGMPGATIPGGFEGAARCYQANAEFSPMVAFADNIFIGYSWHYLDTGTDGTLAATFPIMACVVSCSGLSIVNGSAGGIGTATGLGEDGQGMLDMIDVFCTSPATSRTFTFGTSGPPPFISQTSLSMEIREAAERAATDEDYNDVAPIQNIDTLTATPATIGTMWMATFQRAQANSGRFTIGIWRDRTFFANGIAPTAIVPPWPAGTAGRCMTAGAFLAFVPPTGTLTYAGGLGTATSSIPLDFVFCGLHYAGQARSGAGLAGGISPRLSSAVEGTIGTF